MHGREGGGVLERAKPEGAGDREGHRRRVASTIRAALTVATTQRPLAQRQQALAELLAAAVAMGQQAQLLLLTRGGAAQQLDGGAEGTALAEAEQRPDAAAEGPGSTGHHGDLQPQGQLPAGGMGPGRGAERTDGRAAIVAGGGAAVGAGQIQHPAEAHSLQGWRHQGAGAAEGIEIHNTEAPLSEQAAGQQVLGRQRRALQPAASLRQGQQVAAQPGQAIDVGIVRPHQLRPGLQAVAQGTDAAARHQIEHAQTLRALAEHPRQQHPQIA